MNGYLSRAFFLLVLVSASLFANNAYAQSWTTVITSDGSGPVGRHESNAVVYNGMIYLIGGRGERPVDRYNPVSNTWETIATAPEEMHHFQLVIHDDKFYIIGAFRCCFPNETTIAEIHVFDPADNSWSIAGTMPASRLRGSTGAVSYNDKIYVIGGNTLGHNGGAVPWFDEYDPATDTWTTLPDAPTARDHFGAVIINNQLIATGGRQSANSFDFTVATTDIYDFSTNQWTSGRNIPTERAGTTTVVYDDQAIIIGGESVVDAHRDVEAYNPRRDEWRNLPNMINPRHAGGAALIGNDLHVFTGSTTQGGTGESNFHEVIDLSRAQTTAIDEPPPAPDNDDDGLSDEDELNIYFTNPEDADSDNDGLSDFHEVFSSGTDPNNADSDNDQINDNDELDQNLDPNNTDTDGDGLSDGDELIIHSTDATSADSDGDGLVDGDEVNSHNTDPQSNDSDGDGITDGVEINELASNPLSTDSDVDGLSDFDEYNEHGTSLISNDTDSDGLTDLSEIEEYATNPLSVDTDNDAVSDGDEILIYQSNPVSTDTDGDGISDGQEIASGTSLNNIDDDNDGIINQRDGTEDSDGDGLPNYADRDSDNDGIPDLVEVGFTDVNHDGQLDTAAQWNAANPDSIGVFTAPVPTGIAKDSDGDGVADYLDLDSDQDGIPDLSEASSDYTTSNTRHSDQPDDNRDGLTDLYSNDPADDDQDTIPNHLDLDSDDDGISDLLESGILDADDNGLIDDFIDNDGDGLSDFGRPELGQALPDGDSDSLPDLVDAIFNTDGRFGCTLSNNQNVDLLFLGMLLLSIGSLFRRRRI